MQQVTTYRYTNDEHLKFVAPKTTESTKEMQNWYRLASGTSGQMWQKIGTNTQIVKMLKPLEAVIN